MSDIKVQDNFLAESELNILNDSILHHTFPWHLNRVVGSNNLICEAIKISKKSAVTLKIGKQAFYKQIDMKLSDAYNYASKTMVENMLKLDAKEGIDAFINKRKPKWQDK